MDSITRNRDVVSGLCDLEFLATIPNVSARMGVSDDSYHQDKRYNLNCYISKSTGMLQISPLLDLNFLYGKGHGAGTVGGTWDDHHKEFRDFIAAFHPSSILEPGGGHGNLAKKYVDLDVDLEFWNILEPSNNSLPPTFGSEKISVEAGFFDSTFVKHSDKYSAVVHSHVLEHIYEPFEFLKDCWSVIEDHGYLIFSIPNVDYSLKEKYSNFLMFEHTYLASEEHISYMCRKAGFTFLSRKYFKDHSTFFCFQKNLGAEETDIFIPNLYERNKKLYLDYIAFLNNRVMEANLALASELDKDKCFVFGAHIFSQVLFASGLNEERVSAILDNDSSKIGKRLYGWNLMVESPEILRYIDNPLVVLNAGAYNAELKKQILGSINSKARFI